MKGAPLPPIGRSTTALVLHDMQNDFIKASLSTPEMQAVVKKTKGLIDLAHKLPMPVIYTRVESDPAMTFPAEREPYLHRATPPICVKGTTGAEVIDELKPAAGDYVIAKVRSSAFHETKLETLLRVKGVWILIVAGGSTNWGVEWLARDAKSRDIVTVALRDCTYSATSEVQNASLTNIDDFLGYVLDSGQVTEMLSKAK
ncbi:MAG: cysteine hydrolase [Deltaproteobacteria bacterium]|nr:cysteine hydrolase [Deltaproteobacteria bacterium]